MAGLVRVRAGMTIGRAITAAHLAALQADTQVQPVTAGSKTVLATIDRRRQLFYPNMVEMRASGH